ncbi:hypothetical protein TSUD_299850 [Trifolium subterraneum]|uniref:BZIP domain-containing protein n=1 Tax=Trifolium subterraneum TaxID=3900 RepID=A0A2Z6PBK7_TRISU|nr:hypothetical protein TSUD_299850 [Trifolium subterraneum]
MEEKTVERKQKRMIKNRESAARSRARKQIEGYISFVVGCPLEGKIAPAKVAYVAKSREVPPLFLDVHSNHIVLDMCAALGSKTFQLLEILHRSTKAGSLPDGMVLVLKFSDKNKTTELRQEAERTTPQAAKIILKWHLNL